MSYCLNPACTKPDNPEPTQFCQSCGAKLLVNDRYLPKKVLGRGGFGTTFLAIDAVLPGNPGCVIKQLRPVVTTPHVLEMARELFHREAVTLGKIGGHPQLPRLLDFFEQGSEFYLVQEYVAGGTLQQEVRRNGPFDEAAVRTVLQEILPILTYLHGSEVIHRDIKPANILRRSIDNKMVLIDFGAVKDKVNEAMAANPQEYSTLTSFAVGTPGFAPPEQMAMRPVYASDLYALGVTCVYLLTGKSPRDLHHDPTTGELMWRNLVRISDEFANILTKMMEASVKHRFQSAQELLQALTLEPQMAQLAQNVAQGQQPQMSGYLRAGTPARAGSMASPASRSAVAIRSQQARVADASLGNAAGNVGAGANYRTPGRGNPAGNPGVSQANRYAAGGNTIARRAGMPAEPASTGSVSRSSSVSSSRVKFDAPRLLSDYKRGRRDFTNQEFNNLSLRKFELSEAVFHQAQFQNADLHQVNFFNSNLGRASFAGASLREANLTKAYMSFADLSGADLRGANLSDAYLNNANLRGTNLCGANLIGASVTEEQLALARTNWKTILPSGKRGSGL
jgi:serine/threonine protein kinase, bacterial